jgi:hypothetical protein
MPLINSNCGSLESNVLTTIPLIQILLGSIINSTIAEG